MKNKVIDGVARELLERCLLDALRTRFDDSSHVMEIRALLAAPEAPRQEPVAAFEVARGPIGDDGAPIWVRLKDLQDFDIENLADGTKLYLLADAPLSPDHSGGGAGVVLPSDKEIRELKIKAARQADLTSGASYYTAAEFAADAMLDKVKELNQ